MNEGAARLRELFPDRGASERIAEKLGTSPSVANRWIRGERKPGPVLRDRLHTLYGIPWLAWERRVPSRKRKAAARG